MMESSWVVHAKLFIFLGDEKLLVQCSPRRGGKRVPYTFVSAVNLTWLGNMVSLDTKEACLSTLSSCGMFERGIMSVAVEGPTTAVSMISRGTSVTKMTFPDAGISREVTEEKKSKDQR